jgi:type IV pilus assembly protein PilB
MADIRATGNAALLRFAVQAGFLSAEAKTKVDQQALDATNSGPLIDWLVAQDGVSEHQLAQALAATCRLSFVDLPTMAPDAAASEVVPEQLATRYQIVPLEVQGVTLVVATANPFDQATLRAVEFATGKRVRPLVASRTAVRDALAHVYHCEESLNEYLQGVQQDNGAAAQTGAATTVDVGSTIGESELPPVVKLLNLIVAEALRGRASDIHVEADTTDVRVRYRINGLLEESLRLPKWVQGTLAARCKVLAGLDITERRVPQDGRIRVRNGDSLIDLRVSILPTQYGEKITMRILDPSAAPRGVGDLKLPEHAVEVIRHAIRRPEGLILVTGPTGSGKTTTLYGILAELRSPTRNIVTIENPIEYQLPGVNQVEINEKQGLTFAGTLRSILRQDPDVILVGEIRDAETAQIAMRAAQTGHLVLSTLHTNDTIATITRLIDLGIEPYVVSSTVHLIIAQRLVRRICPSCAQPYTPDPAAVRLLRLDPDQARLRRGIGCRECRQSGWGGRIGVFELLRVTPPIARLIEARAADSAVRAEAEAQGLQALAAQATARVAEGATTVEEVLRAVDVGDTSPHCPTCDQVIEERFSACPHCRTVLRRSCAKCAAPLAPEWLLCPHCLTPAPDVSAPVVPPPDHGLVVPSEARLQSLEARLETPARRHRILIVDDHSDMRTLVKACLERSGLPVTTATACDGYEALRMTEQDPPDLIVLDVMMPGLDGLKVCEALRASVRTAFIPIMILTARDDTASRVAGFLVGTDDYLTKPFVREELVARVRRLIERTYGVGLPHQLSSLSSANLSSLAGDTPLQ